MTELWPVEQAWERLKLHIEWADRFWLVFVFTDDPRVVDLLRDRVRAQVEARGHELVGFRPPTADKADVLEMLEVLVEGRPDSVAWVDLARHDASESTAWRDAWQYTCMQLNQRREVLRRQWANGGIVLASTLDRLDATPGIAPDLWTIRSLLLRVATLPAEHGAALVAGREPLDSVRARPTRDPELARQAVDRARRRLGATPSDAALALLAQALETYGTALGSSGRRDDVLPPALEAVDIFRSLARANPGEFAPAHAEALNNLSVRLNSLGQREAALATSLEAVQIWRMLAAASPGGFLRELAQALNNLGICLSSLSRHEEAMEPALEAVQIWRTLARVNPGAFQPHLARALNNLGVFLSSLGRREEALDASLEAVQVWRTLAAASPNSFLPDHLAGALDNLGIRLSSLGRSEEAITPSLEAVRIWRTLVEANSDAFLPDLARALSNLGSHLRLLGRREDALAVSLEALPIWRTLAETNPDAFLPDLVRALYNLGLLMGSLGQHPAARDHCAEGLRLILPYFVKLPAAHGGTTSNLARQLRKLEDDHGVALPESLAPAVALILRVTANEPPSWSQADLDRLSQLIP